MGTGLKTGCRIMQIGSQDVHNQSYDRIMKILESQSMPVDIIFESENETMLNTIKGLEKEIKAGLETLALSLPTLPMENRILVTSGKYENEVGTLVDTETTYKT